MTRLPALADSVDRSAEPVMTAAASADMVAPLPISLAMAGRAVDRVRREVRRVEQFRTRHGRIGVRSSSDSSPGWRDS